MKAYLRNSRAHIFPPELLDKFSIAGDDYHHLIRVMRLGVHDHISAACDGFIREYEITIVSRDELRVHAIGEQEKVEEPEIHIVVSLFKLDRLEMGIAKAIEAGATSITIGSTSRSSVSIDARKKEKVLRRAQAIALSAAMQSRRARIVPLTLVGNIVDHVRQCNGDVFICAPEGESATPSAPVTLVIGPEGGFADDEIEQLSHVGKLWRISPYILRADTAMALAPGLIAAEAGR